MIQANYFGHNLPDLKEILEDSKCKNYILSTLVDVLKKVRVQTPCAVASQLIDVAVTQPIAEYERLANKRVGDAVHTLDALNNRSSIIYGQINPYVHGRVLDLGCGDGNVGNQIAKSGLEVTLADVYRHPNVSSTGLPFVPIRQSSQVPVADNSFDTTLLLTVLHHADDPLAVLREARRVTKPTGGIVVIESVYGIHDNSSFGQLTAEQQRMANIFFDHFYNRVLHFAEDPAQKVNVPFNFNTPEGWSAIFEEEGLEQTVFTPLGIDQPTVPEYHTLHVVQNPK